MGVINSTSKEARRVIESHLVVSIANMLIGCYTNITVPEKCPNNHHSMTGKAGNKLLNILNWHMADEMRVNFYYYFGYYTTICQFLKVI